MRSCLLAKRVPGYSVAVLGMVERKSSNTNSPKHMTTMSYWEPVVRCTHTL